MGLSLIYWTSMCSLYFLVGSILEKCGNLWGKTDVFLGGYGQIGEKPHSRIRLD